MRTKFFLAALLLPLSLPVEAALAPGANAPDFSAAGAMAGKPYSVNLKAGATVIGMTAGNVDKLIAFSSEHCAGKFAVAAASPAVIKGYDVLLKKPDGTPTTITSRTSYVIAPNGHILFAHTDMNPADHIKMTLEAVRKYKAGKRG
jgi:peroxiredoxin Q/BCP